jgi:hypothetical protein
MTCLFFHYNYSKMQEEHSAPLVEDLYMAANKQFPWEAVRYVVPAQYPHQNPNSHPPQPKASPKLNYLDHLLRTKRTLPAPNAYKSPEAPRPLSGKMD